jgi:hypothetical protein
MKDTIKNSIIGAFAIFGLVALISSSNNAPTVIHEGSNTPESHVWEMFSSSEGTSGARAYIYNKQTGEVRKFSKGFPTGKHFIDGEQYGMLFRNYINMQKGTFNK